MSINRATWPRRSLSSSALALLVLIPLAAGAAQAGRDQQIALAFERTHGYDTDVWIANGDGSNAHKAVKIAFGPSLSPDGRRLAYRVPRRPDALPILWVRTFAGRRTTRIDAAMDVAWGPQGRRLVYSTRQRILLADVESGRRRLLARGHVCCPSFAPGGDAVVFTRSSENFGRGVRSDVYAIRLSDGQVTRLTHDGHSDKPVWGRGWIAYSHFHGQGAGGSPIRDLRLMRPDGSGKRLLADGHDDLRQAELGIEPVQFSQDGRRLLACLANEFGCPPVTFSLPDGRRHILRVRRRGEQAWGAAISRDGTQVLAEVGKFEPPWRVVAVPFAGGTPRVLARNANGPTWSR
jgi:hypothetical protein